MTRFPYTEKLCDMKHDTGPAETEHPASIDHDAPPVITPDALVNALVVAACIGGFVVLAVWLWAVA